MSDRIIIRDVLPERIQLREPAFYNGLSTYQLYVQETTEETPLSLTEWLKLVYGVTPEFNKSATHVQWRVEGSETWIDLFPLSDIKGDNGNNVQFRVTATHIQWRVVGDVDWINLIALSEFKGEKGDKGNDGSTPYIGENGNWWINGEDTGENAVAPNMSVIEQYVQGYAEPKKGIDDFYVSAAQVILINDIVNKVDKITGYSLVADTEIAKIHSRNTDSTLLSENGLHSVYVDNAGVFHVKDISQVGTTYTTHAEQLFTTKNEIILRDGAIAGLGVGEYVGLRAKLYDGVNDGHFVFDRDGWARVGDVGALQKLATIEESPTNGHLMRYNTSTFRLESYDPLLLPVSTAASRAFVSQNGGTIYHITRWFTPTSALTIAANGLSATITSGQFTSGMTGAKLKLTGGVNEPIITYVSTNQITLSFAVDASFFGQSVAVADWGVYSIEEISIGGIRTYYTATGLKIKEIDGISRKVIFYSNNATRVIDIKNEFGVTTGYFRSDGQIAGNEIGLADDATAGLKANVGLGLRHTSRITWNLNYWWDTSLADTALYRPSAGLLQIYDGITTTALRDLKLRSLFADKIIPNSDTTGVVIRNAADTADVVKVDTGATKRLNVYGGFFCDSGANINNGVIVGFRASIADIYFAGGASLSYYNGTEVMPGVKVLRSGTVCLVGIDRANPETTLDVNGATTHRDWVYLNNGTHTGDAVGDYRYKVLSGVLTFQKCTTANSVRGNGGWTTVSTI